MRISVKDGSDYFRGLLLLLRKDRHVAESEIALVIRIGASIGFEPRFCENAAREILENAHVADAAPVFSTRGLAEMFLRDGLAIASADGSVDPEEEAWLRTVAVSNGIAADWLLRAREEHAAREGGPTRLEADALTIHAR